MANKPYKVDEVIKTYGTHFTARYDKESKLIRKEDYQILKSSCKIVGDSLFEPTSGLTRVTDDGKGIDYVPINITYDIEDIKEAVSILYEYFTNR